jgi:hypothetical protein
MKMTLGYKIIQKIVIRLDLEMNKAYTSMFWGGLSGKSWAQWKSSQSRVFAAVK